MTASVAYYAGDLNTDTIEDIWNSSNMKKLRVQMINNQEPEVCKKCFDVERVTGSSLRTNQNAYFSEVIDTIPQITLSDGTCTEMKLRYWDFRFSNLCNFKCRSCGPRYSSSWIPDYKKMTNNHQDKVWEINTVSGFNAEEFVKSQINYVEKIYFAGGEPLIMKEHWDILDLLLAYNKTTVPISYNTNCSTLNYNNKNILDYWIKWPTNTISVSPSIDEIDERAELIRSGTVWSTVESNLKLLVDFKQVNLHPNITVGVLNVFRLPEIIQRLVDIGVISSDNQYRNFNLSVITNPAYLHVAVYPLHFRLEIIDKIKNFILEFNSKNNCKIDDKFYYVLSALTKTVEVNVINNFIKNTRKIDKIRNENSFETIPELNRILSQTQ